VSTLCSPAKHTQRRPENARGDSFESNSAGDFFRPGAAGLRNRLTPLSALRSPSPCVHTVLSGEAHSAAPRERERRFGLLEVPLVRRLLPARRGWPPGSPGAAERTSLSRAVLKHCPFRRSTLSGAPRTPWAPIRIHLAPPPSRSPGAGQPSPSPRVLTKKRRERLLGRGEVGRATQSHAPGPGAFSLACRSS